jgi:hypothetical protein
LYGSGRNSTTSITLNMAVLTPMPSAMVAIAAAANPGAFRVIRSA